MRKEEKKKNLLFGGSLKTVHLHKSLILGHNLFTTFVSFQLLKEIFQGKDKRFDVAKALSATTVREFEEAISMISYGYESIKDFYVRCNVRNSASKVRTPLLFIQVCFL